MHPPKLDEDNETKPDDNDEDASVVHIHFCVCLARMAIFPNRMAVFPKSLHARAVVYEVGISTLVVPLH
jgi:hypothetical protein